LLPGRCLSDSVSFIGVGDEDDPVTVAGVINGRLLAMPFEWGGAVLAGMGFVKPV